MFEFFTKKNKANVSHKLKGPKRLKGESFEDYKKRRKHEDKLVSNYMKGELVHYPGGKRSMAMLMYLTRPQFDKQGNALQPTLSLDMAKNIADRAQGTLKGNPTGNLQPNGLPERKKPVINANREI